MSPIQAFSFATSGGRNGRILARPRFRSTTGAGHPVDHLRLMLVAGINLLRLHRLLVLRQIRAFARDEELRLYFALLALAVSRSGSSCSPAMRFTAWRAASGRDLSGGLGDDDDGFATLDWTKWARW